MNDLNILVLLSGGKSTRMGSPKGLLDYRGEPWILEQISRFKHIEKPIIYIGLGYDHRLYLEAIPWFEKAIENAYNYDGVDVRVVINLLPQLGSFSTLQSVLNAIDRNNTVVVQPIDVPILNIKGLSKIINEDNLIVIPTCSSKNGHPVKLKPKFWNLLLTIDPTSNDARLDTQIKKIDSSSVSYVNVLDSSVYQNINTINKWNSYLNNIS